MKAIINGRVVVSDETGNFVVRDGLGMLFSTKIEKIVPSAEIEAQLSACESVIDVQGAYVSPGFINVHLHGCAGSDVMDGTVEALETISSFQAKTGVTGICPTTMTNPWDNIVRALQAVRQAKQKGLSGARMIGVHLGGPFVSRECCGAQPAEDIIPADFSRIRDFADMIKIITVAPEELTDERFMAQCHEAGIVVSLGHSAASYAVARQAIDNGGATHITHLCNGMKTLHHREPGLIGAALDTAVDCELIADDIHIHPAMQRIIFQAKQAAHIILITDSMRACGLGDGVSELGGKQVFVHGLRAVLEDGTLAGSVLTLDRAVANFAANTGADIAKVIEFVTKVPAENLGIYQETGSLAVGKQADITIFNDDLVIQKTIVGGEIVYEKEIGG